MEKYYQILGLKTGASKTQVREAYLKLAKKYHPDKNHQKKEAEEKFKAIQMAYDILISVQDKGLQQKPNPAPTQNQVNWADVFRHQQQKIKNQAIEKKKHQLSWQISLGFILLIALFSSLGYLYSGWWFLGLLGIILGAIILSFTKLSKTPDQ